MNNAHGGVSLLVKLVTLLHGCFSHFLNCTNGTKSRNAPHIRFASIITTHSMLTVTCNFFFHLYYSRAMPRNDETFICAPLLMFNSGGALRFIFIFWLKCVLKGIWKFVKFLENMLTIFSFMDFVPNLQDPG